MTLTEAGDEMNTSDILASALNLMLCACAFNVPYACGAVTQELTVQCVRCRALQVYVVAGGDVAVLFNLRKDDEQRDEHQPSERPVRP